LRHAQGFSRGLDADRTDRFVGMYVNAYTVDYGELGRRAVGALLARAHAASLIPAPVDLAFIAADS
jgi:1,4-dihydroxy-6-naphthoate synthase